MPDQKESKIQKLRDYCAQNALGQPRWQDFSDPRGIRTAWSSSVFVQGVEYRTDIWRDFRYLDQSHEEVAELAFNILTGVEPPSSNRGYSYARG